MTEVTSVRCEIHQKTAPEETASPVGGGSDLAETVVTIVAAFFTSGDGLRQIVVFILMLFEPFGFDAIDILKDVGVPSLM